MSEQRTAPERSCAPSERYEPVALVPTAQEMGTLMQVADRIAKTDFVPKALQGRPDAVLAAALYGREVGIGPMQALNKISVIQGRPSMAPELMRALVLRSGHRIWREGYTDEAVTVAGRRRDDPDGIVEKVTWTKETAVRAQLWGKGAWVTYPRAMLLARATAELCRSMFPDVLAGMSYTPEELGAEVTLDQGGEMRVVSTAVNPDTGEITDNPKPDRVATPAPVTNGGEPKKLKLRPLPECRDALKGLFISKGFSEQEADDRVLAIARITDEADQRKAIAATAEDLKSGSLTPADEFADPFREEN